MNSRKMYVSALGSYILLQCSFHDANQGKQSGHYAQICELPTGPDLSMCPNGENGKKR